MKNGGPFHGNTPGNEKKLSNLIKLFFVPIHDNITEPNVF